MNKEIRASLNEVLVLAQQGIYDLDDHVIGYNRAEDQAHLDRVAQWLEKQDELQVGD